MGRMHHGRPVSVAENLRWRTGCELAGETPTNIGEVSLVLRCAWSDYRRSGTTLVTYLFRTSPDGLASSPN